MTDADQISGKKAELALRSDQMLDLRRLETRKRAEKISTPPFHRLAGMSPRSPAKSLPWATGRKLSAT
jgi:hypothetical protein